VSGTTLAYIGLAIVLATGLRWFQLIRMSPYRSRAHLAVTDRFNLRNPKNVTPMGIAGMPIPTTFLADRDGVVLWIDQADDSMLRSDPDRVRRAIRTVFA
jgi:hypothetical protein